MEMMQSSTHRKSEEIELVLARLLRLGALAAAVLMAVGLVLEFTGMASAAAPHVITAGLVVLVATPVLRVAVAMIVFLREKDLLFALFCLVVLASLAAGMIIGKVE